MNAASLTVSSLPETAYQPVLVVPKAHQPIPRQVVPIIDIVAGFPSSRERVFFCYEVLQRTLNSLIHHKFSDFDAHTKSNCCHGLALLARELILQAQQENLEQIYHKVRAKIDQGITDPNWQLPSSLIRLSQLYILHYICEGGSTAARSNIAKLLDIAPVNMCFCKKLINRMQKSYANEIATRYEHYLNLVSGKVATCNIPADFWGKYIRHSHLRLDAKGRYYASTLFSMQIVLANLIYSKSKIAVLNDILDQTGKMTQYIRFLQGDGEGNFYLLERDENEDQKWINEPIVVFRGCARTDNPDQIISKLDDWIHRFSNLVLANDVFYPQFPSLGGEFQDAQIVPEEDVLQELIIKHGQITGVSVKDPTFYCLNHIYLSSLHQVHQQSDTIRASLEILSGNPGF